MKKRRVQKGTLADAVPAEEPAEEPQVGPEVAERTSKKKKKKKLSGKLKKVPDSDEALPTVDMRDSKISSIPAAAAPSDAANTSNVFAGKKDGVQVSFSSLGVCEELCNACELLKWSSPTMIQADCIPWALQGRDIIGLAETGSGKTGAFALPIVQRLLDNPQRFYACALAPTRELCVQIGEQFEAIGSGIKLQTAVIVGGLDMVTQAMALAKRPHVVVATPGRLVDHLENTKGFHLKTIKYLVLDEADRLLSMDFDEALDKILGAIPRDRNTFLFSATMTSKVSKLQRASLRNPVKVEVNTKHDTAKTLVQGYMFVPHKFKQTYFSALLSHYQHYSAMIFVDTCLSAQKLAIMLRHLGMSSIALHGQMSQAQRLGALGGFKAKDKRILVCTDVASRGLDVPAVDLVINYDIPRNSKDYIHRVGRTARAGRAGRAVTMVTQYDIELFQRIEHFLGKKLEEFLELKDTLVKAGHERVLEAMRSTELELRDEDEQTTGKAVKRKLKQLQSKGGRHRKKS
eukprot:TRINITY_DN69673_c0_g1_i1.p1 TRINITY_DN69673_c0_g1~~TRINITY_DN69673_c0_g1_i1.p1  ORF type:complete len:517 (-),score=103.10 TRINITY_DN69673_c0_g1_i1:43-1593(-)